MGRLGHALGVLSVLPLVAVLGACGLSGTNDGGYISGDGQVHQYAVDERSKPVELEGKTLEGKPYDLTDDRGKVVVLNVWGAWCGECIAEASELEQAHRQLGAGVSFVGIDIRDASVDNPLAFQRGNKVTYPSIYSPDGKAVGALARYVSPRTVPATAVLDKEGRVAAIIRGTLPSKLTLVEVVKDVEKS